MLPALQSGGVERGTLEVGKHLVDNGHRSIVISGGGRMVDQLVAEGSEHVEWDVGRKSLMTLLRYIRLLRRLLAEERVDILHLRSRMPAWVGYLAWKGMDPATRPKLLTTVHGFYSVNRYSAVMTKGERVIAVSNSVRDYILESYPKCDPDRISVIHRGVDPEEFPRGYKPSRAWLEAWLREFPQLKGRFVVTLPGRLTRWKGQVDFIEIIATLRRKGVDAVGVLVGGFDSRRAGYVSELEEKIASVGLESQIVMTGHRDDVRDIVSVSDVVLSLSTDPEAFGRTTLEALSLGRPVIGYDHGGVGEQLTALFPAGRIPPGDREALAYRIMALSDHLEILDIGPFSLRNMVEHTAELYAGLVSERSNGQHP